MTGALGKFVVGVQSVVDEVFLSRFSGKKYAMRHPL